MICPSDTFPLHTFLIDRNEQQIYVQPLQIIYANLKSKIKYFGKHIKIKGRFRECKSNLRRILKVLAAVEAFLASTRI